jgi:hypothetical protein
MKSTILIATLILLTGQGGCQGGGKVAKADSKGKAPLISRDQVTRFFKAQARNMAAQQQLQNDPAFKLAQAESDKLQSVVREIQATCGTGYEITIDAATQDPVCTKKPPTPPPSPKVEKK